MFKEMTSQEKQFKDISSLDCHENPSKCIEKFEKTMTKIKFRALGKMRKKVGGKKTQIYIIFGKYRKNNQSVCLWS